MDIDKKIKEFRERFGWTGHTNATIEKLGAFLLSALEEQRVEHLNIVSHLNKLREEQIQRHKQELIEARKIEHKLTCEGMCKKFYSERCERIAQLEEEKQ